MHSIVSEYDQEIPQSQTADKLHAQIPVQMGRTQETFVQIPLQQTKLMYAFIQCPFLC